MKQNECDHIIGMHHHYDMLLKKSEENNYKLDDSDDDGNFTFFNFCPDCGVKLLTEVK